MPVFGVSRNKTLLVDSGQDSVVLAQSFESLRFPLEQGESFSNLSCLTCARQSVRLASSVSNLTSRCNERTWNAKSDIMTSPEREASKTSQSTKRSAALRSPTGITPTVNEIKMKLSQRKFAALQLIRHRRHQLKLRADPSPLQVAMRKLKNKRKVL